MKPTILACVEACGPDVAAARDESASLKIMTPLLPPIVVAAVPADFRERYESVLMCQSYPRRGRQTGHPGVAQGGCPLKYVDPFFTPQ